MGPPALRPCPRTGPTLITRRPCGRMRIRPGMATNPHSSPADRRVWSYRPLDLGAATALEPDRAVLPVVRHHQRPARRPTSAKTDRGAGSGSTRRFGANTRKAAAATTRPGGAVVASLPEDPQATTQSVVLDELPYRIFPCRSHPDLPHLSAFILQNVRTFGSSFGGAARRGLRRLEPRAHATRCRRRPLRRATDGHHTAPATRRPRDDHNSADRQDHHRDRQDQPRRPSRRRATTGAVNARVPARVHDPARPARSPADDHRAGASSGRADRGLETAGLTRSRCERRSRLLSPSAPTDRPTTLIDALRRPAATRSQSTARRRARSSSVAPPGPWLGDPRPERGFLVGPEQHDALVSSSAPSTSTSDLNRAIMRGVRLTQPTTRLSSELLARVMGDLGRGALDPDLGPEVDP